MTVPADSVRVTDLDGSVVVTRPGEAVVLAVAGEFDYGTAAGIRQTVLEVLAQRPALVVIDLLEVGFLGSAGLALLAEAVSRCGTHTRLRVVASGPATLRPVQLTGLTGYLGLCSTVEEALASR